MYQEIRLEFERARQCKRSVANVDADYLEALDYQPGGRREGDDVVYHSLGHLDSQDAEGPDTREAYNLTVSDNSAVAAKLTSPDSKLARLIAEYAVTPAQLIGAAYGVSRSRHMYLPATHLLIGHVIWDQGGSTCIHDAIIRKGPIGSNKANHVLLGAVPGIVVSTFGTFPTPASGIHSRDSASNLEGTVLCRFRAKGDNFPRWFVTSGEWEWLTKRHARYRGIGMTKASRFDLDK